jgi:nucleotide-binding universal stress UspA family protein
MLVGPGTEVSERRPIEELVVAVSGTVDGESICQPAIELADADRFAVHFVTVVEADSEPTDPRSAGASRRFGPAGDEHAYIADLTRRHERPGVRVEGSVIHDPLSPASGLARMMRRRPQSILVLGSTARTGLARLRHGSVAGRIIAESPAPAIVVASPVEASALSA